MVCTSREMMDELQYDVTIALILFVGSQLFAVIGAYTVRRGRARRGAVEQYFLELLIKCVSSISVDLMLARAVGYSSCSPRYPAT
jgi:ABC-type spermidine/putrescine transport system permease subunit II